MDSRNYELAAEFCQLVGTPDLLAYLGVEMDAGTAETRTKLKSRRKYMQGMQSNPKYRSEALYLIKHFAALDAVLANPAAYLKDAVKRAESVHLPVLEMTIRSVLAGGAVSPPPGMVGGSPYLPVASPTCRRANEKLLNKKSST